MAHVPQLLPNSIPIPTFIISTYSHIVYFITHYVPGGECFILYLRKSHQDDPYRTAIEISLIIYGIVYYLSKPQSKKNLKSSNLKMANLSANEIDQLIEEWEPESIIEDSSYVEEQMWRLAKIPVIENHGITNQIDLTRNKGAEVYKNVFNMSSNNFLGLSSDPVVLDAVKKVIKNYGVGACGPAGFYGNQDVHFAAEYDLANFFGTEGAVLYGQDFCVASSVIPAFTKRGDIIVADDQISITLQNALQLSRSTVYFFEHNNMESLDALLNKITEGEKLKKLPAIPRKFIVTEGLFHNSGDIAPLPELTRLKNKWKFRLFLDETYSLGVLGETGRGITEFYNMDRATSVDVTVGSMATAFGSSGGFVLGDTVMSLHQRIGSNAYCFSASLPAYTVKALSTVLHMLDRDSSSVKILNQLSIMANKSFVEDEKLSEFAFVTSNEYSPIVHIQLSKSFRLKKFNYTAEQLFEKISMLQKKAITTKFIDEYEEEEKFLQSIVDDVLTNHNILISRNTMVLKHETLPTVPSLKLCINAGMTQKEVSDACNAVKSSIVKLCSDV